MAASVSQLARWCPEVARRILLILAGPALAWLAWAWLEHQGQKFLKDQKRNQGKVAYE